MFLFLDWMNGMDPEYNSMVYEVKCHFHKEAGVFALGYWQQLTMLYEICISDISPTGISYELSQNAQTEHNDSRLQHLIRIFHDKINLDFQVIVVD